MSRTKIIPATESKVVHEGIFSANHIVGQSLDVVIGLYEEIEGVRRYLPEAFVNHAIVNEYYKLLMSEAPLWDAKKPSGKFNDSDVFELIELRDKEIAEGRERLVKPIVTERPV